MLAHEVVGEGPPLVLIHGTLSGRGTWAPIREALAAERRLILVDWPGMGESPAVEGVVVPRDWTGMIGEVMDALGAPRAGIVGHSMGGWTALELAREGRATGVLALAPAGLWERPPKASTRRLRNAWRMSRLTPRWLSRAALSIPAVRRNALRDFSADGGRVSVEWAIAADLDARNSTGFPAHIQAIEGARFEGGAEIEVPVHVVFAGRDRLTTPEEGQLTTELPAHARIENWPDAGHSVVWDETERVIAAAREVPVP